LAPLSCRSPLSIRAHGATTAASDEAENLSDTLYVCKGARVMLTKNLWGERPGKRIY
jgi:hypothetical protein